MKDVINIGKDPRVFRAINDEKKVDKSFMEKENFFTVLSGGIKYSQRILGILI